MKRNPKKKTKTLIVTAMLACVCFTASAASIQYGDAGSGVTSIQKKLITYGYHARTTNEYDANTKWAVRLFQRDHGLPVDGIVGPETYKKLMGTPLTDAFVRKNIDHASANARITKWKAEYTKQQKQKTTNYSQKYANNNVAQAITRNAEASPSAQRLLRIAEQYEGVPYVWGGTTPDGFDCSGYTQYVFNKVGIHLPRLADAQYEVGTQVSRSNLRPGDLVFFETYEPGASHSGIYVGNGNFISATSSRGIAIAPLDTGYWGERYLGARRVM